MEHKRYGNTVVVRMDPGEEILEQIALAVKAENVTLGSVSAIGAVNDFTVGLYDVAEKKYFPNRFTGAYEIVSLLGNVTQMNGEPYIHLHMAAADDTGRAVGGHLNRAVISVTCEMFITEIEGEIDRVKDEKTGINVFRFE